MIREVYLSNDAVALRYQENQLELNQEPPPEEDKGIWESVFTSGMITILVSLIAIMKIAILK